MSSSNSSLLFQEVHRKIEFPNNVTLFVHTSVSETKLEERAPEFFKTSSAARGDDFAKTRPSFWGIALLTAVITSLSILLLGSLVGWIFAGFVRDAYPRSPTIL